MANTYECSDGTRVLKSTIDSRVKKAKARKIDSMLLEHGYIFCEEIGCGRNASSGEPIDCSHDISVDKCQKMGQSELAYDVDNITMRCRPCHRKYDNS